MMFMSYCPYREIITSTDLFYFVIFRCRLLGLSDVLKLNYSNF